METTQSTSANLLMRDLRESDFEAVLAYRSNPEVCRYIGEPMTASEVRAHLERCKGGWSQRDGEALNLGVELRAEGVLIGEALFRQLSVKQRQVEMGLALNPLHQGRRLGLEAGLLILRHCFETLGAHRVVGLVDVENAISLRGSETIGFRREGILRQNVFRGGQWRDEYLMAVLEEEWPEVRKKFQSLLSPPSV